MTRQSTPVLIILALIAGAPSLGCDRDSAPADSGVRRAPEGSDDGGGASSDSSTVTSADARAEASAEAGGEPEVDAGPPPPPPEPPDLAEESPCVEPDEVALFVSPRRPLADGELRIMIVSDEDIPNAALWIRSPEGEVRQVEARRFHGPPHAWSARLESLERGTWRVALSTNEGMVTCEDMTMRTVRPSRRVQDHVWPVHYRWDRRFENLYSAWIMQLFSYPPDERPSWRPLHEVLRDPERNWLYNRLGINEDGPDEDEAISATPDCADTPYWLRAYFAWKMRLLFTFSGCTRGRGGERPQCYAMFSNLDQPTEALIEAGALPPARERQGDGGAGDGGPLDAAPPQPTEYISEVLSFDTFMNRVVVSTVQSGAGRLMPGDNDSDLYPLELSRDAIRPGTVFVDPYGHLLVVSQWVDQADGRAGMLFAIDGHPDLSIGRKRFWRGAFLFVDDLSWGAGGFKAFRPAFLQGPEDRIDRLTNTEIAAHEDWGNFSDEQYSLGTDGFYERMDRVINPEPLDPQEAQRATLTAFSELVDERIDSVRAGEDYMEGRNYRPIEMPNGPEIFETSGPWEDYSTPARDLRLLIAIDLVTDFHERVITNPSAFDLPSEQTPQQVVASLREEAQRYLESHFVTYRRSNGAEQRLSLARVIERRGGLEMGYNPNDCIEIRWAAPVGSEESSSCQRHAPAEQRARMSSYRDWFHTRTRPPRR